MPDFSQRYTAPVPVKTLNPSIESDLDAKIRAHQATLGYKFDAFMDALHEENFLGKIAFYIVALPCWAFFTAKDLPMMLKEIFGCGKWYKQHDFQWGGGVDKPWWMYCTKCRKPVWND